MKTLLLSILILVAIPFGFAQNTYYTGWDNAAENAGWTQLQKGDVGLYKWEKDASTSVSSDSCLAHYYPVGGSVPTDNWFISPAFDFSAGGWIDTLWHNYAGFGSPMAGDTIVLYLLNGSSDPDLATKTVLYNFTDSTYTADNTWYEHLMIPVGTHAGNSYLAFRYYTTYNWLDVKFDNLYVTSYSTVATEEPVIEETITLYPNPASTTVNLELSTDLSKELTSITLYDNTGRLIQTVDTNQKNLDVSNFESGIYFLHFQVDQEVIVRKLMVE